VRGVDGQLLERGRDHLFDHVVGDGARHARAGLVDEPVEAVRDEPAPPLADCGGRDPKAVRDVKVRRPGRAHKDDPRSLREPLGALRSSRPPLERRPLVVAEIELRLGSASLRHGRPPSLSMQDRDRALRSWILDHYESLTQDTRGGQGNRHVLLERTSPSLSP
jgi:hypothetical protein